MISQVDLKSVLKYNPESGVFNWIIKPSKKLSVGSIAGFYTDQGYIKIGVKGSYYFAHRLAWLYMTGDLPIQVDHIDMNRANNSWENLRNATNSENSKNRKVQKNSKLGIKNIAITEWGTYFVRIQSDGVRKRKAFKNIDDAVNYAISNRCNLHGSFANHG